MFIQKNKETLKYLVGYYLFILVLSAILPFYNFFDKASPLILPVLTGGYTSLIISLITGSMPISEMLSKNKIFFVYPCRLLFDIILFVLAISLKEKNGWLPHLLQSSAIITVLCNMGGIIHIVSENFKIQQRKNKENEEFKKVVQNHITKTEKRLEKVIDQLEEIIKKN